MNLCKCGHEEEKIFSPCYYKGERGNKPYPLETMLRLYLLQNLYDLSDEATRKRSGLRIRIRSKGQHLALWAYKAHTGVDKDSGLVRAAEATAANVHDVAEVQNY